MWNFMKIRPVGAELFHEDGQTDRHGEVNSRFTHFDEDAWKEVKLSLSAEWRCVWEVELFLHHSNLGARWSWVYTYMFTPRPF